MKLETSGKTKFPRWTVRLFHLMTQTVRYIYRDGKRVDVQFEEFWIGHGDIGITRTYSWADKIDRQLIRAEMSFVKRADDLEKLDPFRDDEYMLHAVDPNGQSVLVVLDDISRYGIDSNECPEGM